MADVIAILYISGRCYCQLVLLVVDVKTTCFISSIMADLLPWWLMLLPLSCKLYKMADVIAMVAVVIAFFFFFFFCG